MPKKCEKCSRLVTNDRRFCLRHGGIVPKVDTPEEKR